MSNEIEDLLEEGTDSRRIMEIYFSTISKEKLQELVEKEFEDHNLLNPSNFIEYLKSVFILNEDFREKDYFETDIEGQLAGYEYIETYELYIKNS